MSCVFPKWPIKSEENWNVSDVIVLKFGGAAVSTPESFATVADIIIARQAHYQNVAVVVSAMGDTTDELLALAHKVNPNPPRRELDMLVSVGERISTALLSMALAAKGKEALSLTGSQSGIITSNNHFDAEVVEVRPKRILGAFAEGKVAIVAGFQGMSLAGDITTLGRGGSDVTAVALAGALGAKHVEFFKDVGGVYDRDPKRFPNEAHLLKELSYAQAFQLMSSGAQVLHSRCVMLAEKHNVALHVLPISAVCEEGAGSIIR